MQKKATKQRGLYSRKIDEKNTAIIDPDNVFWGVVENNTDSDAFIPEELLALYNDKKEECDQEMKDFRFKTGLTAVYIDPTDACNANCPYCYISEERRSSGKSFTQDELDTVLDKIYEHFQTLDRKAVVIFHAAEPLMVKDILFKSIDKFKDKLYFGIQTNSLLLEEEDVEFIKSRKVSIGISIDAPDHLTNNSLRVSKSGDGNFDKAVQALEWFTDYKGLNVICTVTKANLEKLPALVKFLHGKRVRCVLMNPVRLTRKSSYDLRPEDKLMAEYFIKAIDTALECTMNSEHEIIIGNFTNTILSIIAPTARRLMCDISPCGGGRTFFTVTANGDMIPCGEFVGQEGFVGGNIFTDSISDVMDSEEFKKVRDRYVEKIPECDVCSLRNICGAPCPAELNGMGDMYGKAVFCEFYKEIIAYAFKLIAQGKEKYLVRKDVSQHIKYDFCV